MNMRVDSAGGHNLSFTCYDICAASHDHALRYAVHNVWVACFADTNDHALFDSDICLIDTRPVHDESISHHKIEGFGVMSSSCLAHSLTQCLTTTEFTLITVDSLVALNLDPEICAAESNEVSSGRAKHSRI